MVCRSRAGQAIFPGCAVKAALKVTVERAPREPWITGSNDVAMLRESGLGIPAKAVGAVSRRASSGSGVEWIAMDEEGPLAKKK